MEMLARRRYIFRGHADAGWPLSTTLDRFVQESGIQDAVTAQQMLLAEFRKEAVGIADARIAMAEKQMELELLARHHGLPTTILDWTRSPYVAAFFAFGGLAASGGPAPEKVAIWCLDLSLFNVEGGERLAEQLQVIDDPTALDTNPRAIEQQSVFLRVDSDAGPVEGMTGDYLRKFEIPATERGFVLGCLDEMRISDRSLFRDLEAAARTASWRVATMAGS